MQIHVAQGHSPDLLDDAVTVAIDVIRAFTMTHCALLSGAERIHLYRSVEEAREAKALHPEFLLAGERKSRKIEGFDLQNSPAEVSKMDLSGQTMILTTTNGVPSALHGLSAGRVLVTGFSNARTTAGFLRDEVEAGRISRINILGSHPSGEEDMLCARFIESLLLGEETEDSVARMQEGILASTAAQKFLDPAQSEFNSEDLDYCIREVASDFVMELGAGTDPAVTVRKVHAEELTPA